MASSKFDIVVYGATGFTGQLVAEYLAAHYKGDGSLKWAMAGRSKDKLASVRDAIGAPADIPLIVADASDPASLKAMVAQTKSVITTVGPYMLYGNELLAACVAAGVDYFDLCGEPIWMRQKIDQHEAAAKKSGARIVFSCGYNSLPFELGVFCAQEEAKKAFGAQAARVKGRVRKMSGTFSGGTAASMRAIVEATMKDLSLVSMLRDPFILTPGFDGPKQPLGNRPVFDEDLKLDRAVRDGQHQHAQRPPLQHAAGFPVRQRFRLRRDGHDRAWRTGRGDREEGDGGQQQVVRHRRAEARGGAVERGARGRPSTICCSSRSRPMASRPARSSRAIAIPATARPQK